MRARTSAAVSKIKSKEWIIFGCAVVLIIFVIAVIENARHVPVRSYYYKNDIENSHYSRCVLENLDGRYVGSSLPRWAALLRMAAHGAGKQVVFRTTFTGGLGEQMNSLLAALMFAVGTGRKFVVEGGHLNQFFRDPAEAYGHGFRVFGKREASNETHHISQSEAAEMRIATESLDAMFPQQTLVFEAPYADPAAVFENVGLNAVLVTAFEGGSHFIDVADQVFPWLFSNPTSRTASYICNIWRTSGAARALNVIGMQLRTHKPGGIGNYLDENGSEYWPVARKYLKWAGAQLGAIPQTLGVFVSIDAKNVEKAVAENIGDIGTLHFDYRTTNYYFSFQNSAPLFHWLLLGSLDYAVCSAEPFCYTARALRKGGLFRTRFADPRHLNMYGTPAWGADFGDIVRPDLEKYNL